MVRATKVCKRTAPSMVGMPVSQELMKSEMISSATVAPWSKKSCLRAYRTSAHRVWGVVSNFIIRFRNSKIGMYVNLHSWLPNGRFSQLDGVLFSRQENFAINTQPHISHYVDINSHFPHPTAAQY